jgi:hypothetical protein
MPDARAVSALVIIVDEIINPAVRRGSPVFIKVAAATGARHLAVDAWRRASL